MFGLWHWSGIQGFIRTYYKLNHSTVVAENLLVVCERALTASGLAQPARAYAVELSKRLRKMGCDKASAYGAAACAYCSTAFVLDPRRCEVVIPLIQDSLDNAELMHPIAVAAVVKARDEMLEAMEVVEREEAADQVGIEPALGRPQATSGQRRTRSTLKHRRIAVRELRED